MALERFDFLRCAILAASQAAVSIVVHLKFDGLEALFWIGRARVHSTRRHRDRGDRSGPHRLRRELDYVNRQTDPLSAAEYKAVDPMRTNIVEVLVRHPTATT